MGNQGFTLIEVLIAIFILSIGIFAVGKLQSTAIDGDFKADKLTRSCSMASNEAERLLRLDFNHPYLNEGRHGAGSDNPGDSDDSDNCQQFCIGWEVTQEAPLRPLAQDTDGSDFQELDDNGNLVSVSKNMAKTIDIIVFSDADGFEGENNQRFKITIVKPRYL